MKIILKESNKYILRFNKGEEFIESLIDFCAEQKIEAGYFLGLGAAGEVELSWYDIDEKKYSDKVFGEKMEIASMSGNIAKMGEKTIIHVHGVFSDEEMNAKAGHIKKMVAATCEIIVWVLDGKIEREYSEEIGLNLMK